MTHVTQHRRLSALQATNPSRKKKKKQLSIYIDQSLSRIAYHFLIKAGKAGCQPVYEGTSVTRANRKESERLCWQERTWRRLVEHWLCALCCWRFGVRLPANPPVTRRCFNLFPRTANASLRFKKGDSLDRIELCWSWLRNETRDKELIAMDGLKVRSSNWDSCRTTGWINGRSE